MTILEARLDTSFCSIGPLVAFVQMPNPIFMNRLQEQAYADSWSHHSFVPFLFRHSSTITWSRLAKLSTP